MSKRREASIYVTIKNQGFLAGMRKLGDQVEKESRRMRRTFRVALGRGFEDGLKASKESIREIGKGIKDTAKNAATFGGVLGGASLINSAMQLQGTYAQIAFEMERISGKAFTIADAQELIDRATEKTRRSHEEMATAMQAMLQAGADPRYAVANLDVVGEAMNATKLDAATLGTTMGTLSARFKLSGSEGRNALEQIVTVAKTAKVSAEDLITSINDTAVTAQANGMRGAAGFTFLLNAIAKTGSQMDGTASEINSGLDSVMSKLRDAEAIKNIFVGRSVFRFRRKDFEALTDATDRIKYIAKAGPTAMQEFKRSFTGREERVAFDAIFKPYFDKLNANMRSKGRMRAHAEAVQALQENINGLFDPVENLGTVAEQSAKMQETSAAAMRHAFNQFNKAMTQPEMLEAIDRMAEALPPLAQSISKVIGFIAKHPMLAAGAFVGAKVGFSFAEAGLASAGSKLGDAAGKAISKAAAAHSGWGVAGRALGVAAGAAAAYYIASKGIDSMYEGRGKDDSKAFGAEAVAGAAIASGDVGSQQQSLAQIRSQISELKNYQNSFTGKIDAGLNQVFGTLAGVAGLTDGPVVDTRSNSIARLEQAEKALLQSIEAQQKKLNESSTVQGQVNQAMRQLKTSAQDVANAFNGMTDRNGPKRPSYTGPGHSY